MQRSFGQARSAQPLAAPPSSSGFGTAAGILGGLALAGGIAAAALAGSKKSTRPMQGAPLARPRSGCGCGR